MLFDVSIAFFLLGVVARVIRSDIQFPASLYQSLSLFLMIAIGLKGGVALAEHASWMLIGQSLTVIAFGFILPLLAFPILKHIGQLSRIDAASIAAHYGSVSVGTYAVAVGVLESQNIPYEAYIPLFVVLLEMPAIAIGIALAQQGRSTVDKRQLVNEIFCNQGVVLMVGGLIIGYLAADNTASITPFFFTLFHGVLALFLLEMGMVAASRFEDIKRSGSFMLSFGIGMPLVGGLLGCCLGLAIGLSVGGASLLAVLGASASYIAVPAAMRVVLPDANHSLSISASLGITFPFNVLVGIPTYFLFAQWFSQ